VQIISDFKNATAALRRTTFDFGDVPSEIKKRIKESFLEEITPEDAVRRIIAAVRDKGDAALVEYTKLIDGIELKSLEVSVEERRNAYGKVDKALITALNTAAEQVRSFHQVQMRHSHKEFMEGGVGQIVRPLEKVGIYVPGGTASYPSTVLMTAIPARIAGVREIILTTPPKEGGEVPPATLVAADIAGKGAFHASAIHAAAPQEAAVFSEQVRERFSPVELFTTELSPVVGTHTGPGLIGLGYYTEPA